MSVTTALPARIKAVLNGIGQAGPLGSLSVEFALGDFFAEVLTRITNLGASGELTIDTIAESTSGSGVTVDGCLVKDGRAAALATAAMFHSTEQTGTGSEQDVAHGLGAAPSLVFAYFTELDGNAADIADGTHDATNAKFTVTSGQKFRVVALK